MSYTWSPRCLIVNACIVSLFIFLILRNFPINVVSIFYIFIAIILTDTVCFSVSNFSHNKILQLTHICKLLHTVGIPIRDLPDLQPTHTCKLLLKITYDIYVHLFLITHTYVQVFLLQLFCSANFIHLQLTHTRKLLPCAQCRCQCTQDLQLTHTRKLLRKKQSSNQIWR